jgi:hypothetical protein
LYHILHIETEAESYDESRKRGRAMNQKDRFELEAAVLLAAYAYAVQGYAAPAAVLGILAAVLAVESHSGNLLMKLYPEIVLLSADAADCSPAGTVWIR